MRFSVLGIDRLRELNCNRHLVENHEPFCSWSRLAEFGEVLKIAIPSRIRQ